MSESARILPPVRAAPRPPALTVSEASTDTRPPATAPVRPPGMRPRSRRWPIVAWVLGIAVPLTAINVIGMPYYVAPMAARVRHPWHSWLRPSGTVGLAAGIVAVVIFVFLWLYPLRKKYRQLAFLGSLGKWMDAHISAALALPLLLAIHSAWRADGLIGLGLLSMLVVIASGLVGRYLYVRIPRARNGVELTREEVANRRRELIGELAETTGLEVHVVERTLEFAPVGAAEESLPGIFRRLITDDLMRWRRAAALKRRWAAVAPTGQPLGRPALAEAVRLASQEMSLRQQTRMLEATHRVFRFWHVAHRPFAITALIAVVIHIAVVIAVGAVSL